MLAPPIDGHIKIDPNGLGGSPVVLDGDMWWPLQSGPHPIETGGESSGWMYFLFRTLSPKTILDARPSGVLTFQDTTGKTWTIESKFSNVQVPNPSAPSDVP